MSAYAETCINRILSGLREYADVMRRLREGREYHRERRLFDDGYNEPVKIEIPLLWGTF